MINSLQIIYYVSLTLNFLNRIVYLPFLDPSIINFEDINGMEPGLTAWVCRLAFIYTGSKGSSQSVQAKCFT